MINSHKTANPVIRMPAVTVCNLSHTCRSADIRTFKMYSERSAEKPCQFFQCLIDMHRHPIGFDMGGPVDLE